MIKINTGTFAGMRQLVRMLQERQVAFAGNRRLAIYGTLQCASGKRMKPENRVFFASEAAAIMMGYRPCAHCMYAQYRAWKQAKRAL